MGLDLWRKEGCPTLASEPSRRALGGSVGAAGPAGAGKGRVPEQVWLWVHCLFL